MSKQMNAKEMILEVMKKRNWYGGHLERRKAAVYKSMAIKGKLSYEKSCELLALLGYKKVQEEVWE